MDVVFMQMLECDTHVLATSDEVITTMQRVYDIGVNIPHFVCGLSPLLIKAFDDSMDMHRILTLVSRIALDNVVSDMMRDVGFFRKMGSYVLRRSYEMEIVLPIVGRYADDPALVEDTMRHVLVHMGRAWAN